MRFSILTGLATLLSVGQALACSYTTTTGNDYGGAATNCEVILQGSTANCHPVGNTWVCGCYYNCNQPNPGGERITRTTGNTYGDAATNCEVILQGWTSDCHPTGRLWVCTCHY